MKWKYPYKRLLILQDNLWSHKSSLIIDLMSQYEGVDMLLTPANTPQLNPVENLFSIVKNKLKDIYIVDEKQVSFEVI